MSNSLNLTEDNTKDRLYRLFAAIGGVTVTWARLEFTLDVLINSLFQHYPYKTKPTVSLNKKLKYIKWASDNAEELTPVQRDIHSLCNAIHEEKWKRHKIIHGLVDLDLDPLYDNINNEFEFKQYDFKDENISKRSLIYKEDQIQKFSCKILLITNQAIEVNQRVSEILRG